MGRRADAGPRTRRGRRPHVVGAGRVPGKIGVYRHTDLPASFAWHQDTLLALDIKGEPLHLEHGYPARIIAPNRPGVLQTKWVAKLTVSAPDPT